MKSKSARIAVAAAVAVVAVLAIVIGLFSQLGGTDDPAPEPVSAWQGSDGGGGETGPPEKPAADPDPVEDAEEEPAQEAEDSDGVDRTTPEGAALAVAELFIDDSVDAKDLQRFANRDQAADWTLAAAMQHVERDPFLGGTITRDPLVRDATVEDDTEFADGGWEVKLVIVTVENDGVERQLRMLVVKPTDIVFGGEGGGENGGDQLLYQVATIDWDDKTAEEFGPSRMSPLGRQVMMHKTVIATNVVLDFPEGESVEERRERLAEVFPKGSHAFDVEPGINPKNDQLMSTRVTSAFMFTTEGSSGPTGVATGDWYSIPYPEENKPFAYEVEFKPNPEDQSSWLVEDIRVFEPDAGDGNEFDE